MFGGNCEYEGQCHPLFLPKHQIPGYRSTAPTPPPSSSLPDSFGGDSYRIWCLLTQLLCHFRLLIVPVGIFGLADLCGPPPSFDLFRLLYNFPNSFLCFRARRMRLTDLHCLNYLEATLSSYFLDIDWRPLKSYTTTLLFLV